MRTGSLLSVCLFFSMALPCLTDEPIDIVHGLTDAIHRGNKAAIAPFYATLKDRPLDLNWIDSLLVSEESDFISPTWCFESKTNKEAAVVIVGSLKKRLDLDPCYMVRVTNQWKILPRHTDVEIARATVSESTMKALEELAVWFGSRKTTLLDELGKELEAQWKKATPPSQEEARKLMTGLFSKRDPKGHPTPRSRARSSSHFSANELIGRWRHVNVARKLATNLTFKNDGTYAGSVEVNGRSNGSFSGK